MKKTKLLFFLPNLCGGGAERVTMTIIRKLDKSQFDITLVLVAKTGDYVDLIPKYVNVIDLGLEKTIFSPWKLRKIIQMLQPTMIFSTLFRTHNVLYLSLLGMKKKPIIILRSPNSPKLLLENNQMNLWTKFLIKKAYTNADVILSQTPEMKEEIAQYHHIDTQKIRVFLNPLDTDLIDNKIQGIDNPFNDEMINVVAAGRLTKQKGFDVLIEAFNRVVSNNNKFVLYIIGKDAGEKKNMMKIIDELHMKDNIKLLGFQDNPYKYFFFSDLYVLSSRWEGLPNTVLENLYLNIPVIATQCIPFMDRIIENGKNGLLVEVENVDQLATAIMNYKTISNPDQNTNKIDEVNNLFLDIMANESII